MMKLAVNGRFLSRPLTGVERYGQEILKRLGPDLRVIRPGRQPRGLGGHAWEQLVLPGQVRPGELLWSPANSGPLAVREQVLTLHDLSPLEHPEWYVPAFAWWYRFFVPRLVRRVRQVVVSSEYMRQKMLRRFSRPGLAVTVAPGGVDCTRFRPDAARPAGLPAHYVLFVGSLQPRKNLGLLLQAWSQVQSRYPHVWLLVAGAPDAVFSRQVFPSHIERLGWLGYTPEADLPGLYAGAQVYVQPSQEEGFGLTALEALACGAPLIAARAGALPEVAGEAALWFDPARASQLAERLERCLSDPALRASLAEKGLARAQAFGWERPTEALREVLQQCQ
jgi:glycosyltransferase involved in cell wall biosynthesis